MWRTAVSYWNLGLLFSPLSTQEKPLGLWLVEQFVKGRNRKLYSTGIKLRAIEELDTRDPHWQILTDTVPGVEVSQKRMGCRIWGGEALCGSNGEISFGIFVPQPDLGIELYHCSTISIITLKHIADLTKIIMNRYSNSRIFEMGPQNEWTQFEKFWDFRGCQWGWRMRMAIYFEESIN